MNGFISKQITNQSTEYDIVFVTNQPSFYKVRQWNEISKYKRVLIIFLKGKENDRNSDFVSEQPQFESYTLCAKRYNSIIELIGIFNKIKFKNLLLGGWDDIRLILLLISNPKIKNSLLCESSVYECSSNPIKNILKRLLLTKVSKVFVSGIAQEKIFTKLNYRGRIIHTGGCGLLNYVEQPSFVSRPAVHTFLYVGRLVEVKNLRMLIKVFNTLPQFKLNLVGYGELDKELRSIAKENVNFLGAVDNKCLSTLYQGADVFILPSRIEPWGLVIEEALNNGTPVIVSDKVGCRDDLVSDNVGVVFDSDSEDSMRDAILKISEIEYYNSLRYKISHLDFKERAKRQVDVFINNL